MNWRDTYTYPRADLINFLREMRNNIFHRGYLLRREVYLQASERGLIRLPENYRPNEAHTIPFSEITLLEAQITQEVI